MKLYVFPVAPNPTRVRLYLAEKREAGGAIELEEARVSLPRSEQKSPEHLARNPFGRLPVLEHAGGGGQGGGHPGRPGPDHDDVEPEVLAHQNPFAGGGRREPINLQQVIDNQSQMAIVNELTGLDVQEQVLVREVRAIRGLACGKPDTGS